MISDLDFYKEMVVLIFFLAVIKPMYKLRSNFILVMFFIFLYNLFFLVANNFRVVKMY